MYFRDMVIQSILVSGDICQLLFKNMKYFSNIFNGIQGATFQDLSVTAADVVSYGGPKK